MPQEECRQTKYFLVGPDEDGRFDAGIPITRTVLSEITNGKPYFARLGPPKFVRRFGRAAELIACLMDNTTMAADLVDEVMCRFRRQCQDHKAVGYVITLDYERRISLYTEALVVTLHNADLAFGWQYADSIILCYGDSTDEQEDSLNRMIAGLPDNDAE